jgi:uncharacterized protein YegL
MTDTLFEDIINQEIDDEPIIMIDNSGSTSGVMATKKTILMTMIDVIEKKLKLKKINKCNIIEWNSEAKIVEEHMSCESFNELQIKVCPKGMTDISSAFNILPKHMIKDKKIVDIYVITDGDVNQDKYNFGKLIKELIDTDNKKINIYITSVEPNSTDYKNNDINAGNKLYETIRTKKLTKCIKSFESYNDMYIEEPYINLNNPNVQQGYIPFGQRCFSLLKLNAFIKYSKQLIDNTNDKTDLLRIVHDLSLTLYHVTKNKPKEIVGKTVDMFEKLFVNKPIFNEVHDMLSIEISNHNDGMATTFQKYKQNRRKLFERAEENYLREQKKI